MNKILKLQSQFSSKYDKERIYSYDVEQVYNPTKPIIHRELRFIFITKGYGIIKINNASYKIKPNSCIFIMPWVITEISKVDAPIQFLKLIYNYNLISFQIKNAYNQFSVVSNIFNDLDKMPVLYCNINDSKNFLNIINDIKKEIGIESILEDRGETSLSLIYVLNKIISLILLYLKCLKNNNLKEKIDNHDERTVIFKYLYSHLKEKLTLKSVASFFYISQSTLSNYCQNITGLTFHDLLDEMRLTKIIDFLLYTNLSLDAISSIVGFNDISHLSNFFFKKMQITPTKFRKIKSKFKSDMNYNSIDFSFKIIHYIEENFLENIDELKIANLFNISIKTLNKNLLYTIEMNFDSFINYLRINYACTLLKTTNDTILNIAIESGYNNSKTFNNQFIKFKNITPSKFRKFVEIY